ncbi:hypothetical protein BT96DRAFT_831255 [Gymnopus androsaceus JB14]|uniref:DUF4218 domain-containing protein n=1 Tax=Gymnopus androsaceus JB14 TaxID=1447944 RepID=A0A6A4H2P6_9AGAR|nr:hypothetical protein BT96DRAFT_831255 [Gymnopus androsaceus JB14]
MASHIYDFLKLFGPVISWWCFPFERLIGALQKVNTNDHVGGPLESTIMKSQLHVANIRRWLRRSDCPEAIRQLKVLFDKCFVPTEPPEEEFKLGSHRSYIKRDGVVFSPHLTHEGNATIIYRPNSNEEPIAGRIEQIDNVVTENGTLTRLLVRAHLPLPKASYDPFRIFPDFPAKTYSTQMKDSLHVVDLDNVVAHAARFDFSHNRSVLLNLSRA